MRKFQIELQKMEEELNFKHATEHDKNYWIGKIFNSKKCGKFKIIDAAYKTKNSKKYLCKFIDTNYLIIADKSCIMNGSITDRFSPTVYNIGIIGDISNDKIKEYPYYKMWIFMLHRAYNEDYKNKFPTYKDVLVSDRWLVFSNFVSDIPKIIGYREMIEYKDKYNFNLDKDIMVHNNKIYDLDNCCLTPEKLNSFFINKQITNITGYEGMGYHNGKVRARINFDGKKQLFLGHFDSLLDAYNEYHKNKKEILDYYFENDFVFIDDLIKEKMYIKLEKQYENTLNKAGVVL